LVLSDSHHPSVRVKPAAAEFSAAVGSPLEEAEAAGRPISIISGVPVVDERMKCKKEMKEIK